jgi:DNA-binding MarR family transcriptional regulator
VSRQSGQSVVQPGRSSRRRLGRPPAFIIQEVRREFGFLESIAAGPEVRKDAPSGRIEVPPHGTDWVAVAEPRERFERDVLSQVLGVGAITHPRVDEGVHELELGQGGVDGAGSLGNPSPLCLDLEIHGDENLGLATCIPYTLVVTQPRDWTDRVLKSWGALEPGLDVGAYEVTARISRISQHVARHQEHVFGQFGLNRGDVGVLSALRIAGPPNRLSPTRLFKGLMLSSAGITSRLDRLEKRGLIRRSRDPNDRRGVQVELTDDGRMVLEQAVKANTAAESDLISGLGANDRTILAALLKKLLSGLEAPGEDSS